MVSKGLRLASLGATDEAREIARFVRNSRICDILKPHSGILFDAHLLESQLRDLERACGPGAPTLSSSDQLMRVHEKLDLIAGLLARGRGCDGVSSLSSEASDAPK
jgi:hypothetical protein